MPLFFLSYARIPGDRRTGPDPDRLVFDFYGALSDRVAAHAGAGGADAGFVERPHTTGEQVVRALSDCRAFVPLYSQRYFTDPRCGRQWTAITRRSAPAPAPRIVPVLWTPYPAASVPEAVHETPAVPESAGDAEESYAALGLHQLLDLEEEQALRIVDWLARRIAGTPPVHRAPSDPGPSDWAPSRLDPAGLDSAGLARLPDAFATRPPRPPLRLTVLAPSEQRLPIGRGSARYGPRPLDWRPYGPAAGGPVAEQAGELARNLGFAPEVVSFDKALVELRSVGAPTAPWVLIVDPWALQDVTAARQAREFDTARRPWTAVLTALADNDPQTTEHSERLRELLESTFPRHLREGRIGQQSAVRGLRTADVFALWFGELAESAYMRYLRYIQPRSSPPGPSTGPAPGTPPAAGAGAPGTDEGGAEARP
ncbi:FxsC protein [Streptomyces sp. NPDC020965]|uniref:FxsC protein n=1 Tax=Streptomyces sp. NPDC020965 TaxID=3365105 RepID=UPI00379E3209